MICTLQAAPFLRRSPNQGEDHQFHGLLRQGLLRADGAMADGGDDALNRIGRAQGVPVRGGDVEERQQSPGVPGQAGDGGCRSGPVCFP